MIRIKELRKDNHYDMSQIIGIIGAMEEEVSQLKARMENAEIVKKAGMEFVSGSISGKVVVVVRSGIGKVNAAICAQILCDVFDVCMIINTGIAGSLDARIDIGDMVISAEAVQHDMDATGFGYECGVIPRMDTSVFPADEKLAEIAEAACKKANPDIKVFRGRVLSGDQFVSAKTKKDWLVQTFGGLCTEMEGGAIAQAAWLNGIPYLIIRAISDKADDSAQMTYDAFEAEAIRHTMNLMKELLAVL